MSIIFYYVRINASGHFLVSPQNNGAAQPELNHFAVQMVSQPHYSALFIYSACCVYPDMAIISEQFIAQVRYTELFSFGDFPCIISGVNGGVLAKSLRKPLKLRFLEVPV